MTSGRTTEDDPLKTGPVGGARSFVGTRRLVLGYGLSVFNLALAVVVTRTLALHFHASAVSVLICAVMFTAWFGGFGPGLFTAALSVLVFRYYFVPPIGSFAMELTELPRVMLFTVAAFLVGTLSARQRSATEALRRSEQRFRDYTESASDWSWETGPDHRFTWVSENLSQLGIVPASRIGLTRWECASDIEQDPEKWRAHREALDAHQSFRQFTYTTEAADGSVRHVSASGKPIVDAAGRFAGYRGVASDVTAAARAEQFERALHEARAELVRVTRVTTLGEVAASVAHEVNQPLGAIVNNANACLELLPAGRGEVEEVREALLDIVADGERAGAVIQRIRALASRSSSERVPLHLDELVADVVALSGAESRGRRVTIRTEMPPGLPVVRGDRVELQQVVLNLLVNGMEAMAAVDEGRRVLVIRGSSAMQNGIPAAMIRVEDHGTGLDAAQTDRLFEAFYTTKPHGMGMGLAISRSIIEAHGGRIWAEPNNGPGAAFCFTLPVSPRVDAP